MASSRDRSAGAEHRAAGEHPALSEPTAGVLVRLFINLHDCGHGSFFASRRWCDAVGIVLSSSLRSLFLRLWDEQRGRLIGFRELMAR